MDPQDLWKDTEPRYANKAMEEADRKLKKFYDKAEDGRTHTLHEIAVAMGVTRERVRQIEAKALRKLYRRLGQIFKNEGITPEDAIDMVRKVSGALSEHHFVEKEDT